MAWPPPPRPGQGLLEELSDLARDLQGYADGLEFNPQRLTEVEERLALIENLKRKYGDTTEEILAFAAAAQTELDELSNWEGADGRARGGGREASARDRRAGRRVEPGAGRGRARRWPGRWKRNWRS